MKPLTRSLVRHAHAIARESGARVVMLQADVIEADDDLVSLIQDVDFRVILISRRPQFVTPEGLGDLCRIARVPDIPMTRTGQIKVATMVAVAEGMIRSGDRVVCLCGIDGSEVLDTIFVLDLGTELEMFSSSATEPLPADVAPAVFERLLTIAGELATEGREGRPVGTVFVVGDSEAVLAQSRQLVINPFHGYPEEERNVLDHRLEETVKEFSAIDGAFVIRGDGVLLSAGRYLVPRLWHDERMPHGLGARHEAALGISANTAALAFCISQSTGTVSIFKQGRLVIDIPKPRSVSNERF